MVASHPASPELNPAEHLREVLREDWFANTVFPDLDAVEDTLEDGLIGSNPILSVSGK